MTDKIDTFRKRVRGEGSEPADPVLTHLRRLDEKVDGLREEMREVKERLGALEREVAGLRRDLHR